MGVNFVASSERFTPGRGKIGTTSILRQLKKLTLYQKAYSVNTAYAKIEFCLYSIKTNDVYPQILAAQ